MVAAAATVELDQAIHAPHPLMIPYQTAMPNLLKKLVEAALRNLSRRRQLSTSNKETGVARKIFPPLQSCQPFTGSSSLWVGLTYSISMSIPFNRAINEHDLAKLLSLAPASSLSVRRT